MLYEKRDKFDKISEKVGELFSKFGLSPNQWTLLSLVPALIGFYFVYRELLIYAALFYFVSFFIDVVDGAVARFTGRDSRRGAYIDTLMDRYIEFLFLFSLLFLPLPNFLLPVKAWILLLLFGSLITTYSKSAAKEKEVLRKELKGGLLERAERVILLIVALVLGAFNRMWMVGMLSALAILVNFSAFQRISKVLRWESG